jgi:hypothetical protein
VAGRSKRDRDQAAVFILALGLGQRCQIVCEPIFSATTKGQRLHFMKNIDGRNSVGKPQIKGASASNLCLGKAALGLSCLGSI